MSITVDRLREFMRLYEEELHEQISEDEAREIASRLVELYMLLAEPLPSEQAKATSPPPHSDQATIRTSAPTHQ